MELDLNNNTPIYLQIADMIRNSVITGDLSEGDAIPSVRQVSVEYGLNPQTILNATQLLIQEDVIEKRRGLGMFVKEGARESLVKLESDRFKQEVITDFVSRGKNLGYSQKQLCDLVKERYEEV